MKLKMILASAMALVMAAPAYAISYVQVAFETKGDGVRTYYEQTNGIPRFQYVNFHDITFKLLIPEDQLSSDGNFAVVFGNGFSLLSDVTGVGTSGDSSGDSGIPDYRYGFDFNFKANFDNAPFGQVPLGFTAATGTGGLSIFASSPSGEGYRDEYGGSVTGLRVTLVDRDRDGVSFVYAIPEPDTWALMLVGFGMMGGALRYRRRSASVTYA